MPKFIALFCIWLFACSDAHSQQRIIKGQISPRIGGCTITIKGTRIGTATDNEGYYTLAIPDSVQLPSLELVYQAGAQWSNVQINLDKNTAFIPSAENNIKIAGKLETTLSTSAPSFPFPPPAASAQDVMGKNKIFGFKTLGDFDHSLVQALESLGYFEKSYYAIPNGFALVTRLERRKESEPVPYDLPGRWDVNVTASVHSISDYIQYLFTAPKGYFRVISFMITDNAIKGEVKNRITREQALAWFKSGASALPADIAAMRMNFRYNCTALIYEFEKSENNPATFISSSPFLGRAHLAAFYKIFKAIN